MKKIVNAIHVLVLLLVCYSGVHAQCTSTIYVKRNANGTNDGSSWENAHRSIQAALDQAEACATIREIWVAEGVYKPTVDSGGGLTPSLTANRTLVIDFNVRLYGGFGGYETSTQQRIKHLFPTIISGDQNGDDIYTTDFNSFSFPLNNNADNSYNLMRMMNLNSTTIVDGFIFEGGDADGPNTLSKRIGGAIFNDGRGLNNQSNPIISNCIFRFNRAKLGGGAIYNYGENSDASPTFLGCEFKYNYSRDEGGGAVVNFAKNSGGKSSPNFISCLFSSNLASRNIPGAPEPQGGAVLNASINLGKSEPTFKNCTIVNNQAAIGGGVSNFLDTPILINGSESIINIENTILDNTSTADMSNPNISNTMTMTNVSYSIVLENSVYPGVGNMNDDPQFVDSINFRLLDSSPAIDGGKPINGNFGGGAVYDIENNARLMGSREDIGAYEFLSCPSSDSIYINENQYSSSPNGKSIQTGLNSLSMGIEMAKNCSSAPHILISEGSYVPHRSQELLPLEGSERSGAYFSITRDMKISGGLPSSLLSIGEPEASVITGDIYRNDIFEIESKLDNVFNLLEVKGDVAQLILNKIQVERAYTAESNSPRAPGLHIGHLSADEFYLLVQDCEFRKHKSHFDEIGTIDIDLSRGGYHLNANFINTRLVANDAAQGAAIRVFNNNSSSKLVMDTCLIQGNDNEGSSGGAISYRSRSSLLDDIHIREGSINENEGAGVGGAMYFSFTNNASGTVTIENSSIQDNEGGFGGALFYEGNQATDLIIKRSAIYSNTGLVNGGALHIEGGSAYIHNTIFIENKTGEQGKNGGAIQLDKNGSIVSINNTFIHNESEENGGAIYSNNANSTASFINTIFWNNKANGVVNTIDFAAAPTQDYSFDHSIIEEGACPLNIICSSMVFAQDPLIESNISFLDFTPTSNSPAVNAGDRSELPLEFTDYTGENYRVTDYEIDIGAFEVPRNCIDNLALAPLFPMRNLVGGWSSFNKINVIGPQSTKPNGWLILNSPTVEFNGEYEFDSGDILEIHNDGCVNN